MDQKKYIFVTGGVCSSLGKGMAASSIASLLEASGYKISLTKIDPYLNVDAGTMSPLEHGEVFVTDDGAEADLDLGNYERFTSFKAAKNNTITTGKVFQQVLNKERAGGYLGECVQVVTHLSEAIKEDIRKAGKEADINIIEVGGTAGDLEIHTFLEAIRQFREDEGPGNTTHLHVTLVPTLPGSREIKTKPTQHSVQQLKNSGMHPNILICRSEMALSQQLKRKLSCFAQVAEENIISAYNYKQSLYELPINYHKEGLTRAVFNSLKLKQTKPDLTKWEGLLKKIQNATKTVSIGVVGKYMGLHDAYISVYEALKHGGIATDTNVELYPIDSEEINADNASERLRGLDGILVPGGFGSRGIEGMVEAIRYARESNMPFFGICLGLQIMVIEYARNVLGLKGATSHEFNTNATHPVIDMMEEQKRVMNMGGTMRLGGYTSKVEKKSKLYKAYGSDIIHERHRHRYEVNNKYLANLTKAGMRVASNTSAGNQTLVEALEWSKHPYGIGVQYHPEFLSKPFSPHPLFSSFIKEAYNMQQTRKNAK